MRQSAMLLACYTVQNNSQTLDVFRLTWLVSLLLVVTIEAEVDTRWKTSQVRDSAAELVNIRDPETG